MIKLVPDVGAPLTVTAVDLLTETYAPEFNEWVVYGMTAVGYGAAAFRMGGDFVKNVGIASAPLTFRRVYNRVRGITRPLSRRVTLSPVGRGITTNKPEFAGARLY